MNKKNKRVYEAINKLKITRKLFLKNKISTHAEVSLKKKTDN